MSNKLYFFSGTGNSLFIAKELKKTLKEETELINIAKALNDKDFECNADAIGFVFPVYCWGLPLIVIDFLEKLNLKKGQFVFAVCTFGGFPGATLLQLKRILKEKSDINLAFGSGIKMPGNYTPMYGAKSMPVQEKMFKLALEKIKQITQLVNHHAKGKIAKSNPFANFLTSVFYQFGMPNMHKADKSFYADEKCNSCGICERVCPVANVKIKEEKPVWHQNCEQCLACLQWCPQQAIQFGKITIKRKRYQNPFIKLEELLIR